ncbi:MAG: PEP-CTERM sorting domain-containing protein [Aquabacterium sp.]
MKTIRFRPAAMAAAAAISLGAQAQPRVTLDILPTLGGTISNALSINDLGQVAGVAYRADGSFAATVWQPGGGTLTIGALPGHVSGAASGINNRGQVTGFSDRFGDGNSYRAFIWSAQTGIQALALPAPDTSSLGFAINDSGTVAGWVRGAGNVDAATWAAGANPQRLPDPFGGTGPGSAQAINASGQTAGQMSTSNGYRTAFRYTPGANNPVALGTLGGNTSEARGINDSGWVVGESENSNSLRRAFLWRPGVGMQNLGAPDGFISRAWALNDAGHVVGNYQWGADGGAMLWRTDGTMHDLTTLTGPAFRPMEARAINAHAQIAGNGRLAANGQTRGYRLTLHPDWTGGDGQWDDSSAHWDFAGTGTAAVRLAGMHDAVINPGTSVTVRGSANGLARSLQVGGNARQIVTLDLDGGTTRVIEGATIASGGVLAGAGRLQGDATVAAGGRVRVGAGQAMQLAGQLDNAGTVEVQAIGGVAQLQVAERTINRSGGQFNLSQAQVHLLEGLDNSGRLALSGQTLVTGAVDNHAGGRIVVSGLASDAVFWDGLVNNGNVSVTASSAITFYGLVRGAGDFLGAGDKHFAGGYQPGNSPALVRLEGAVSFDAGDIVMELGGRQPGTQHDKLVFQGGTVAVNGGAVDLQVVWWDGFQAQAGDRFDLFDWNGAFSPLQGQFGALHLPTLADGLHWDTSRLYLDGVLTVAVPEPSTYALMALGLLAVGLGRRQRPGRQAALGGGGA